jgi:glycosyltransferase involved in cell wall biosynthesis
MLGEAIQSVLNQSYRDIDIMVLDDASRDNTAQVVASYADNRLRYVRHEKNMGAVNNWNHAIGLADTEYVNVFHGDDRMLPWMIENLLEVLDKNENVAIAASDSTLIMNSRRAPVKKTSSAGKIYKCGEFAEKFIERGCNTISAPSVTVRKRLLEKSGLRYRPEIGPAADVYFIVEANKEGLDIFLIDAPLLEWRRHGQNWTDTSGFDVWFESIGKLEKLLAETRPHADMSLWKSNYAKWFLELATEPIGRRTLSDEDFDFVKNCRERAAEVGYVVSDEEFAGAAVKGFLRTAIKEMGKGNGGMADYKTRRRKVAGRGFKIPRMKEIAWFLEYAVLKRCLPASRDI